MKTGNVQTLDQYWERLANELPPFSAEEQPAAVTLYRELATSGERWMAKHPGTFLYALDDAFTLAKRLNAKIFGTELVRRASA